MGTKNQAMAAKRQQKKARKNKTVTVGPRKPTNAKLQAELATHGIVATADKYRGLITTKGRSNRAPTNQEVTVGILKIIEVVAPIHSTMEVMDILKGEGRITINEEQQADLNILDEHIVKIAEDLAAIRILMEENQGFDEFGDIYIHAFDNVTEIMHFHAPKVHEGLFKVNEQDADNYIAEHMLPGESRMDFAFRLHDQRMQRVQNLYRTVETVDFPEPAIDPEDEIPAEFIPADEAEPAEAAAPIKDIN